MYRSLFFLTSIILAIPMYAMERDKPLINTFIYSHGLTSNGTKAQSYQSAGVIPGEVTSFNYQDTGLALGNIDLHIWNAAVGQGDDITRLGTAVKNSPEQALVLFGESRGAATIINYLATSAVDKTKVKAVVLDSSFDHARNVAYSYVTLLRMQQRLSAEQTERLIPYIYKNYSPAGEQPIVSLDSLDIGIPMLLLCSKQDVMVPYSGSIALYKKLRQNGHKNVHIAVLPHGTHGYLMTGKSAETYKKIVHAFYKQYGIVHNKQYALQGMALLHVCCQPSAQELDDYVNTL